MRVVSQGPKNGSVFINDETVGTTPWISPGDARLADLNCAYAIIPVDQTSHYLKATGFGFSLPNGSIIKGIQVDVRRNANNLNTTIADYSVKIVKGGTIQGDEKALEGCWGTGIGNLIYVAYGSSTDLWGLTWTAEDISASDFGFVISAKGCNPEWSPDVANIDHIRITVYYEFGLTSYSSLPFGAFPGIPQRRPYTV
jgi:hypothetical protein